ncbi:hypothetical protein [Planomonospora venezuelensis]|uniref:Uncharacterized protein n=1 Tax=Planomonospora venezuelensis TaxID=1999 RepID=A0A841D086_PLAVE|nr:hypothetical protein [Planomonospora venezuelensis]MBB5961944.1 hypothetical protein [Planomonospora venezuelensis]GIM98968.1 hypothetical protein Pve01_06270 [Planomonospora venezuelensis]
MKLLPEESQWELLTTAGLREDFQAVWIEGDDIDAITAELKIDPTATLECDLATALRWSSMDPRTLVLWMGGHSPGWTFALVLAGSSSDLSLPDRRTFDFCYAREIDEFYGVSGLCGEEGLDDLDLNDDRGGEDDLDPHLIAVGRVTGRFIDRDWLAERRTLCRVPAARTS